MIGLAAGPDDLEVAAEFFELFKTPWEPAVPGRKYSAVLSTGEGIESLDAELFLVYSSTEQTVDREAGISVGPSSGTVDVELGTFTFPIYGRVTRLAATPGQSRLKIRGEAVDCRLRVGDRTIHRVGYDLFGEARYLLTEGQPARYALTPTLELHIELLRRLLTESKSSFVEVLPRPAGYEFICCLTHDVDFYGIRRHKFDRTLAGFVFRASVGSIADLARGRRSLSEAGRNWQALCSLPFVFLGWMPDFWRPFQDYAAIENERQSTFFLIPFAGRSGVAPDGTVNAWRAAPYGVSEIREEVQEAAGRGSELALHGIDAWRDSEAGRGEREALSSVTGRSTDGIRMHWLYFTADSPSRLDAAGFKYDSTWGYNDAVGYRAGTSQVFRLTGSETMMELPLSIMDSALFSSGRMGLDRHEASGLCKGIVDGARRFGGTVVINWHERSLAPERLWGHFYGELLKEIRQGNRAWFATAGEAVEWFRWRRTVQFLEKESADGVRVQVSTPDSNQPGAVIRVHRPGAGAARVDEIAFNGTEPIEVEVPTGAA
jgi:hypothetical protein